MPHSRVLVTGAASGMGAAVAAHLLRSGADVVLLDRAREPLERLVDQFGRGTLLTVDLMDQQAVREQLGGLELDGVANIAGLGPDHPTPLDVVRVNLIAPFLILQAVRPHLRPGASVVNVASMIAHVIDDRHDALLSDPLAPDFLERVDGLFTESGPAYAYAKRTVRRLSMRLAVEWAPDVRVNAISPGIINTPMTQRGLATDEWTRRTLSRIPLGRMGEPSDVAEIVAFLLSPAAAYLTGIVIPVDGGALAAREVHLEARRQSVGAASSETA